MHDDLLKSGPVHGIAWTERPGRPFRGDPSRLLRSIGAPSAEGLDLLLGRDAVDRIGAAVASSRASGGAVHVGPIEVTVGLRGRVWLDVTLRAAADLVEALAVDVTAAQLDVAEATDAMHARGLFLATMSHEIRTPLNGILGLLQVLETTELDRDQRELLHLVTTSGEHLQNLIGDVLDLSKAEAGEVELEQRCTDASAIAREVAGLFRHHATESGLTIECEPITYGPQWVLADEHRLRQILTNLVSNAVKFTEEGEVRIAAGVAEKDGRLFVEFDVMDTGPGIADPEGVFDPFRQAGRAITRTHGGTGLGLSICRRLTDLMGGTLQVESEVGVGSTFRFRAPVQPADAEATGPEADGSRGSRLDDLRVLVAEDNPVNQRVVTRLLARLGVQHDVVADGEAAVERASRLGFDVVLMDLHMPLLHGIEAARRIRADLGARAPIIVPLTADVTVATAQRCADAGMERIVSKPFRFDDLRAVLVEIASRGPRTAAA